MLAKRLIAKLDIKSENVVKGVHMEGLKIVGVPGQMSARYNEQRVDELVYIDTVASLYGRNHLRDVIRDVTEACHIPVTVGGGIRNLEATRELIMGGADKVAINTYAHQNPSFLTEAAKEFGSQAVVLSVHAKKIGDQYMCFSENGREYTGRSVVDWVKQGYSQGAGEILLTSIDNDGTGKGFDIPLIQMVADAVPIPVVASGGAKGPQDLEQLFKETASSGACMASALHHQWTTLPEVRSFLHEAGVPVRKV